MGLSLLEAVNKRIILGDGGMGTQLVAAGLTSSDSADLWNLTKPEIIFDIQNRYCDSGSQILVTNTFGTNRLTLRHHNMEDQQATIIGAAVEIARRAIGAPGWVLGDVGPFGGFLEPMGDTTEGELYESVAELVRLLVGAGVNGIIIETQTALDELEVTIRAAKSTAGDLPIIASLAFDKAGDEFRTMMGVTPEQAIVKMTAAGVDIVGCNCGKDVNITEMIKLVEIYRQLTDKPIMAQPNAGSPVVEDGQVVYQETPAAMAEQVRGLVAAGAKIIGGCCGTTPEHIGLFRKNLAEVLGN